MWIENLLIILLRLLGLVPAPTPAGPGSTASPDPTPADRTPPTDSSPATGPVSHPMPSPRAIGRAGIDLIRRFEGCAKRRADGRYEAYPDPATGAAPWTIGWGATGSGIGSGTIWDQAQCDARLVTDLIRYAREVDSALGDAPTSQNQFDALVSFHYNTGAIHRATLVRKHRSGDYNGAKAEFARWVHAGGRIMNGLVRRREAEAQLYSQA